MSWVGQFLRSLSILMKWMCSANTVVVQRASSNSQRQQSRLVELMAVDPNVSMELFTSMLAKKV